MGEGGTYLGWGGRGTYVIGVGLPTLDGRGNTYNGVPPPPPHPSGDSKAERVLYAACNMPLAFTQEDFIFTTYFQTLVGIVFMGQFYSCSWSQG